MESRENSYDRPFRENALIVRRSLKVSKPPVSLSLNVSRSGFGYNDQEGSLIVRKKLENTGAGFVLVVDWDGTIATGFLHEYMPSAIPQFRNLERLKKIFMKVRNSNGCIAIATYSTCTYKIQEILCVHFPEFSGKIAIYGGFTDRGSNFGQGKNPHIAKIKEDSGITDNCRVLLLDDDESNCAIAIECGYDAVHAGEDDQIYLDKLEKKVDSLGEGAAMKKNVTELSEATHESLPLASSLEH